MSQKKRSNFKGFLHSALTSNSVPIGSDYSHFREQGASENRRSLIGFRDVEQAVKNGYVYSLNSGYIYSIHLYIHLLSTTHNGNSDLIPYFYFRKQII